MKSIIQSIISEQIASKRNIDLRIPQRRERIFIPLDGIAISNIDKFELDRRNELSGILPVVPKVDFSFIKLLNGNYVVVIKIYRGVYKPYLYRENEDNYRFYVRRGSRKQAMSYMEIRDDFLHSHLLAEEVKRFRKDRLLSYIEEYPNTPLLLSKLFPQNL